MSRKLGCLKTAIVVLGLGLPLYAEALADFASQIQADVAVLSAEPALVEWQRFRPGGNVELAHYLTENDAYEIDFARLNRWCAASVAGLQFNAARAALFYVPSIVQGVLPAFPASEDGTRVRECRIQAIWYETAVEASIDALVNELSSFWGKPNGQTTTPDTLGQDLGRAQSPGIRTE